MLDRNKVQEISKDLQSKGIDALLLGPGDDLEYLGGLKTGECERFKGLFILSNGKYFYVTPYLYSEEFEAAFGKDTPAYIWEDKDWFYPTLARAMDDFDLNGKQIAVNYGIRAVDAIEIADRHRVKLVNGWHFLDKMRIIKSSSEVEKLERATQISDAAFRELLGFIRPGMTEGEIKKQLIDLFEKHGADGPAFDIIVARRENASKPHYNGSKGVIGERDLVLVDFGCRYESYCSDTTRTVFVGEPTEEEKKLYEIVLQAQEAGEAAVRPGVPAEEVDRAARKVIEDAGYGKYFNTRLGHGIGVAVHEAPYIMEGNKMPLEPGMAFSIEPGIYIPGKIGIRIENIVVVTKDGCKPLSKLPKEITVI